MKFLDLNGLNHLWTKIKASFGTAIVNNSDYSNNRDNVGNIIIPFVANHQIINMNLSGSINVYNWFQKASKGGILEIFFAGAQGSGILCSTNNNNNNYLYKMGLSTTGPMLDKIEHLETRYDTYARLIKISDDKLIVAEFVQNKK
jgi:hypothetical protein